MSDLVLRPYRPDDIPAVTKIYGHYVRETVITFETSAPDEAEMANRFAAVAGKGHPLLIGEMGGEVVGYAYASTYRPREAYRFTCEDSIYLAPAVIGQGIGGKMLARLIEDSSKAGLKQMLAVITAERENSIRLHARHGFRMIGRYEALGYKFDRWLDIVHMQRAL
ncbi:MAG: N-acetyltransferase [Devosia sp.]|uniref:GNAT family N-acetyltransferase n=1 Tax=Devosia sp. TaxID=1871048 RepID=UPI001A3D5EF5|nr:GNAT family N-acetyltransferase [Devosia sp.]MBL8597197.1 N-acetyltransferase [Devosia sp.]